MERVKDQRDGRAAELVPTTVDPRIRTHAKVKRVFNTVNFCMADLFRCSKGQDSIVSLLDSFSRSNAQMGAYLTIQISSLRDDVKSALGTIQEHLKGTSREFAKGEFIRESRSILDRCQTTGNDIALALRVLYDLHFEQMHYRHNKISEAHPHTYEWIFADQFGWWAQSAESLFWISGKPGSGKSTLMRYLTDNERTPELFKGWCGEHKLVIATYFFWINGSPLQRSREGLLRALLFDLLRRQCPAQIPQVLPERWKNADTTGTDFGHRSLASGSIWTRQELVAAFHRLCKIGEIDTRFCVFIDGLDEYDGDHEDLIETIQALEKFGVKLCVASRPWNVFEEAFGSDKKRRLYMQELNKPDMQRFVDDRLVSHKRFLSLPRSEADDIVSEIVKKSHGVFLWVYLVVRSLLEGLRNSDSIHLLKKRLNAFPSDLDEFFRQLFNSLDPIYRTSLAHMFQIALAAPMAMSPIAYSFLDDIEECPDMALHMPLQHQSRHATAERIREVTIRINGRSKGLMEVGWIVKRGNAAHRDSPEEYYCEVQSVFGRVDFLHRTVKDFLVVPEIQSLLKEWQRMDFDPNLAVCKMSLAELKYIVLMNRTRNDEHGMNAVVNCLFRSAKQYELRVKQTPSAYLVALDEVRGTLSERRGLFREIPTGNIMALWPSNESLTLAVFFDLQVYARKKLSKSHEGDDLKVKLIRLCLLRRKIESLGSSESLEIATPALSKMIALIYSYLEDDNKRKDALALIRKEPSIIDPKDFEKALIVFEQTAAISEQESKELRAGQGDLSLEQEPSAHESPTSQTSEHSPRPTMQKPEDKSTLPSKSLKAASGTSKWKSFRESTKRLVYKFL